MGQRHQPSTEAMSVASRSCSSTPWTFRSTSGLACLRGATSPASPYVALGDSYSSAAGVTPLVPDAPAGCSRSELNYAHDNARATSPSSFTDVTCSGAKTSDFFTPQAVTPPDRGVVPQLDAVTRGTRLVTMTIGGNDENVFVDSFFGCATLKASDATGAPCANKYGAYFDTEILTQTYPHLVRALTAVRKKAPAAAGPGAAGQLIRDEALGVA